MTQMYIHHASHTVCAPRRVLATPKSVKPRGPLHICRFVTHKSADELLAHLPARDLEALDRADAAWRRLCSGEPLPPPPPVVFRHAGARSAGGAHGLGTWDVVVLGGTLGVLLAAALQLRGLRCAVVERGALAGRPQEWNLSKSDMQSFVDVGVLTREEAEHVIITEFGPAYLGFEGRARVAVNGAMDIGVAPERLISIATRRFKAAGGTVLEHAAFSRVDVYDDCAEVALQLRTGGSAGSSAAGSNGAAFAPQLGAGDTAATSLLSHGGELSMVTRLVVDCMGAWSPITAAARGGARPDSIMMQVGTCASGLPYSSGADILWGFTPLHKDHGMQYFWETFPAEGGRMVTTYMFGYTDASPSRPSLREMMAEYLTRLPEAVGLCPQEDAAGATSSAPGTRPGGGGRSGAPGATPPPPEAEPVAQGATEDPLGSVRFLRALAAFVPCYRRHVAAPADRVVSVGDACGNRSHTSLAGFAALARHLPRLTRGVQEALDAGATSQRELALLQPASPGVAASVGMQRSMAVRGSQRVADADPWVMADGVGASLAALEVLDPDDRAAFAADCITAKAMAGLLVGRLKGGRLRELLKFNAFLDDPSAAATLLGSLAALAAHEALWRTADAWADAFHSALLAPWPRLAYAWRRCVDAWRYGCGADFRGGGGSFSSQHASSAELQACAEGDRYDDDDGMDGCEVTGSCDTHDVPADGSWEEGERAVAGRRNTVVHRTFPTHDASPVRFAGEHAASGWQLGSEQSLAASGVTQRDSVGGARRSGQHGAWLNRPAWLGGPTGVEEREEDLDL